MKIFLLLLIRTVIGYGRYCIRWCEGLEASFSASTSACCLIARSETATSTCWMVFVNYNLLVSGCGGRIELGYRRGCNTKELCLRFVHLILWNGASCVHCWASDHLFRVLHLVKRVTSDFLCVWLRTCALFAHWIIVITLILGDWVKLCKHCSILSQWRLNLLFLECLRSS